MRDRCYGACSFSQFACIATEGSGASYPSTNLLKASGTSGNCRYYFRRNCSSLPFAALFTWLWSLLTRLGIVVIAISQGKDKAGVTVEVKEPIRSKVGDDYGYAFARSVIWMLRNRHSKPETNEVRSPETTTTASPRKHYIEYATSRPTTPSLPSG
ncbi:hypothetical protein CONLIGDRAFT_438632 [Coniochaeta ligniaria NRRL 30616]|uniref:Uncharacterized protein n=1 Tax=Coniochaeta ligniaria NRRL 30616 TaxID=1408157 RepID=A0A1J7JCW2_9PEZI|nr:hypothetical protein CONLIGDRAFT_438632 [Coniochaeta ligniaria NRRL 30616]